ncbi:MAG: menaquinone biosynthesis protein [Chitinophagales bacterium]|nr:menaquinone biosynthesis protein [Chitinophagales bacterium]
MSSKIKVGAVSYLNTVPLLYGIEHSPVTDEIELSVNYPSILAQQLKDNEIDLALLPVAVIPSIPGAQIISDYGIAADGNVASVAIFSNVPIEEAKTVYLDYQSRTSVMLARLMLRNYWKVNPELKPAEKDFIDNIGDDEAAVIIGDRALQQLNNFEYVYDLSEAWKEHTGLPFIFAAWVANKELPEQFMSDFNQANGAGLEYIDRIVANTVFIEYDLKKYYTECIHYKLDDEKKKGLNKFLELIQTL